MIEKIEHPNAFDGWKKRDIFTVRILSLLESYGCDYNFATFYRQIVDGKITAIISKLDGNVSISLTDGFDNEEIVRFLCVSGYNTVATGTELILSSRYNEGFVMKCDKKREFTAVDAEIDEFPKLMDLYNFVDYDEVDFKAWYVDISHRVRHNTAKTYTLKKDGIIISSGILTSIIDGYSILSAVRTENGYRNKGYGSALVFYICADVKGTVFIMREGDKNESFYKKLGFEDVEKWRMYK